MSVQALIQSAKEWASDLEAHTDYIHASHFTSARLIRQLLEALIGRLSDDPASVASAGRVKCPDCNGTGMRLYGREVSDGCDRCNAEGTIEAVASAGRPVPSMDDAAEMLWVVLANVSGGDWTQQSAEWQEAAARWRDYYFDALKGARPVKPDIAEAAVGSRLPPPQERTHANDGTLESATDPDDARLHLRAATVGGSRLPGPPPQEYRFANPDDELLPLTRCACGVTFKAWELTLSIYEDDPRQMPCCGRLLYFAQKIEIREAGGSTRTDPGGSPQA